MNGFIRLIILCAMIANLTSCASQSLQNSESYDESGDSSSEESSSNESDEDSSSGDSVAEASSESESESDSSSDADAESNIAGDSGNDFGDLGGNLEGEANIEAESANISQSSAPENAIQQNVASSEVDSTYGQTASIEEVPANSSTNGAKSVQEDSIAIANQELPAPMTQDYQSVDNTTSINPVQPEANSDLAPVVTSISSPVTITDLKFKANESGGTVVVQGDQPLTYTTRSNPELKQFIVEVDNAILPDRLKRNLNTKDIKGAVGAIDAYQNIGSSKARFVIQLREGVSEPAVQPEGNSLLIVTGAVSSPPAPVADIASNSVLDSIPNTSVNSTGDFSESVSSTSNSSSSAINQDSNYTTMENKTLAEKSLTDFMTGNMQFYGNKISLEYDDMPVKKALTDIVDQSGLNTIIADDVNGNISLKLRQVPWDQALVVIMRAAKLGYTRQGNLLRIAPLESLKAEEEELNKLIASKKTTETLKVRMFPVSYAKVDDLTTKVSAFLSERGKVVGDGRTNVLVVTDVEENLDRVAKLISSLDIQPQQVLIEGKIVEALEEFTRTLGISWTSSGSQVKLGSSQKGPVNMTPRISLNQGVSARGGNLAFGFDIGTLDIFGSITSALALSEQENKVKVLASPRIFTLSNESADITQTTEVPVKQVTVNGNSTQVTFGFKPLTLKLDVTPQVTSDGSVIMKLGINRTFQGAIVDQSMGSFAVNSRQSNTKVLVKNGQTAVIGGIYQSDATDGEQGIPWFRSLPVIGWMFKSKSVTKNKSELLIFLTPRIMSQVENSPIKEL